MGLNIRPRFFDYQSQAIDLVFGLIQRATGDMTG